MGTDKAALEIGEGSMLELAVGALTGSAYVDDAFVVSSRPDTPSGLWRTIPDLRPSMGPLAAIETALSHGRERRADAVFVLACDLPFVDPQLIDKVIESLGDRSAAAAERSGTPGFEPLCAVYRTDCLIHARALLDRGERAAWRLFEAAEGTTVPVDRTRLANVNTPEELDRARTSRRG